jgi:DNA primase
MRVEFTEVRKIPIASVLSFYKVETRKRSNTELVANCPFPSHAQSNKEHKWTLAISLEKNKGYCHSDTCRAASNKPKGFDCIDVVAMMENLTPLDAAKKLAELFAVPTSKPSSIVNQLSTEAAKIVNPVVWNKPLSFELKKLDPDHPFIRERGISLETAVEFGIGVQEKGSMADRVCFPLYENGSLIGYAGRTVLEVSETNPKWKLPNGLMKTFLYGLEKCDPAKPLILCESPWCVLWMFQHHYQAAALLGSSMTQEQERLLEPYAEIRICMDDDSAGREASEKIAARLKTSHKVTKAFLKD